MNGRVKEVKNKISDRLELPKDIVMDLPKITVMGNQEMVVENHKGIIEYTTELIRVNMGNRVLKVQGERLNIKSILTEELLIEGNIRSIIF